MPKTAAQLVPLKQQLASALVLYRFADATTDFLASGLPASVPSAAFEELVYDNSGTNAAGQVINAGTPLPSQTTTPTGLTVTPSATGGSLRGTNTVYYGLSVYASNGTISDTSWFPYTHTGAAGSVQLTWPAQNFANVTYLVLSKVTASGAVCQTLINPGQTTTTFTDDTGPNGTFGSTSFIYGLGSNNPQVARFIGNVTFTALPGSGGNNWNPLGSGYRISAYNALGETLASNEVTGLVPTAANTPVIPNQTMTAVTATPTLGASGLPTGTYYYVVTATGAFGVTLGAESLPSAEVSATLTGTGTINLTWAAVPGATGYIIYASASNGTGGPGSEVYLASVGSGATTSYVDTGAGRNSKLPPTTYGAGFNGVGSVAISWTATPGVTGYFIYKGRPGQAAVNPVPFTQISSQATTFFLETVAMSGSRYPANGSTATPQNIFTAVRGIQFNTSKFIQRIGVTFTPVAGKRYRLVIVRSDNTTVFSGPYVTFPAAVQQYFEQITNIYAGGLFYIGIQGEDSSAYVTWSALSRPPLTDNPGAADGDIGTYLVSFATQQNPAGTGSFTPSAATGPGGQLAGYYPTASYAEASVSLPLKFVRREPVAGVGATKPSASLVTSYGTLLGGFNNRGQRVVYTNSTALGTPVKSIVLNSGLITPTSPVNNAVGTRLGLLYEVSTDGGTTFLPITPGVRFTFATPASQIQFRITMPQGQRYLSMALPATVHLGAGPYNTGLPANNQFISAQTYQALDDTNLPWTYYNSFGSNPNTYYPNNGGYLYLGYNYNQPDYIYFNNVGTDIDFTASLKHNGGNPIGVFFRSSDFSNGYWFQVDNAGNLTLLKYVSGSGTSLATATLNLGSNAAVIMRVIMVGNHIQCFANGRLVIDTTDNTYASSLTSSNAHAGVRGVGWVYYMQCSNANVTGVGSSPAPQFEIEYLSAYLET